MPPPPLAFIQTVAAGMRSSLQADADAGNPTELEAIGGTVLRAAERNGVDVPVTRRIVTALRGLWTDPSGYRPARIAASHSAASMNASSPATGGTGRLSRPSARG